MKKQHYSLTLLLFAIIFGLSFSTLNAQNKTSENVSIRLEKADSSLGTLYLKIDGKETKLAEKVIVAKLINDGRDVVYSNLGGAGGFENEGQSLRTYSIRYKDTRKILSEYFMIDAIAEKKLSNGKTALLVRMSDGGLGASYFAVVDPSRGQVFRRLQAELMNINGDQITLGFYSEGEWEEMEFLGDKDTVVAPKRKVKPVKTEKHDLKKILDSQVIYNEPTMLTYAPENEGLKKVKLYLWRVNDQFRSQNFVLSAVPRYVNPKAPLRPTLEALFKGVTEDEMEYGFDSVTFGMKFEGVVLKQGVATVKFSQPPNETNYGSLGPSIFEQAVKKTALQFPTVKKVKICAIGDTLFDAQLDKQFPRCSS
jgi:hypothetical protein